MLLWTAAISALLAWALDTPVAASTLKLCDAAVDPTGGSFLFELPDGRLLAVHLELPRRRGGSLVWTFFRTDGDQAVSQVHIGPRVRGPDIMVPREQLEQAKRDALQELRRCLVRPDLAVHMGRPQGLYADTRPDLLPVVVLGWPIPVASLDDARRRAFDAQGALDLVRSLPSSANEGAALVRAASMVPVIHTRLGQVQWVPPEALAELDVPSLGQTVLSVLELEVGPDRRRVYIDAQGNLYEPAP